ncbi:unnamed protein product [Paramecium octaurelia]|uniref:Uncharacterized protein n=1 Tax=Paramecium octaurelia TaxID=43137 RepID=A0A8S1WQI3_PAROT|nr:unnamed protein product [Paramecium octaurelia]
MKTKNIIDIVDAALYWFCGIKESNRLDINISIGMLCRIIFFFFSIIFRDLNTYTWGEFVEQILAWLFFHIYIIYFELKYFLNGESQTQLREKRYKALDMIQLFLGIYYFASNLVSILAYIIFYFFSGNFLINIVELCIKCCAKQQKANYYKKGGIKEFFLGVFLGTTGVVIYLIIIMDKYQQELDTSEHLRVYMAITIFGEMIGALFSYCAIFFPSDRYTWAWDGPKSVLGVSYGLVFGFFSIFYGFLIGFFIICTFFYLCCTCRRSEYVRPAS